MNNTALYHHYYSGKAGFRPPTSSKSSAAINPALRENLKARQPLPPLKALAAVPAAQPAAANKPGPTRRLLLPESEVDPLD